MRQSVSVYYYIDFFILFKLKITNDWSILRHFDRKLTNLLQIVKIDIEISEYIIKFLDSVKIRLLIDIFY